jgi:hypothetical protein
LEHQADRIPGPQLAQATLKQAAAPHELTEILAALCAIHSNSMR